MGRIERIGNSAMKLKPIEKIPSQADHNSRSLMRDQHHDYFMNVFLYDDGIGEDTHYIEIFFYDSSIPN